MTSLFQAIKNRWCFLALASLILMAGIYLRFANIQGQGLFTYDDAWYQQVARSYMLLPEFLWNVLQGEDPQVAFKRIYHWGFYPHITYKPNFIVLLMLTKALVGINNPAAGAILSAVLGVGTIVMMYICLMQLLGNRWTALAGAAITSVSGFQVYYSRFGIPYQLPALALLAYFFAYSKYRLNQELSKRQLYFFGLALGMLYPMNDLMMGPVAVIALFEIGYFLKQKGFSLKKLPGVLPFILGAATPLLAWDLFSHGLRKIFHWTMHKGYVVPYHQEVFGHIFSHHVKRVIKQESSLHAGSDHLYFLKSLLDTEGPSFPVLLGGGCVVLLAWVIQKRKTQDVLLFVLVAFSLVLLFFYPEKRFRLAAPFMPILMLALTMGFHWVVQCTQFQKLKLQPLIALVLLAFLMVPAWQFSVGFTQLNAGYNQVAKELRPLLQPGEAIATPLRYPIYSVYFSDRPVHKFHSIQDFKKLLMEENIRYVLFEEAQRNYFCEPPLRFCQPQGVWTKVGELEDQLKPYRIATFDLPFIRKTPVLWETLHLPYGDVAKVIGASKTYNADTVRLYRIDSAEEVLKILQDRSAGSDDENSDDTALDRG